MKILWRLIKLSFVLTVGVVSIPACTTPNVDTDAFQQIQLEFDIGTIVQGSNFTTLANNQWQVTSGFWPVRCKAVIKKSANFNLPEVEWRNVDVRVSGTPGASGANARVNIVVPGNYEPDAECSLNIRGINLTLNTVLGLTFNQPISVLGEVIIDSETYTVQENYGEFTLKAYDANSGNYTGQYKLIGHHQGENVEKILIMRKIFFIWD